MITVLSTVKLSLISLLRKFIYRKGKINFVFKLNFNSISKLNSYTMPYCMLYCNLTAEVEYILKTLILIFEV